MRIDAMNWSQLDAYLQKDDRAVVPLGCTEQHAYLSLATDSILAERIAVEASEPLGVPVFPALAYGITPSFLSYPGSISLRTTTYLAVLRDMLESLRVQGFRRIALVNGHGGNSPASALTGEWMADYPETKVVLHNWWNAPSTLAAVRKVDPDASHASWMENFPWSRVAPSPSGKKAMIDYATFSGLSPQGVKEMLGDGSFGGEYEKADDVMAEVWRVGVEETRAVIAAL